MDAPYYLYSCGFDAIIMKTIYTQSFWSILFSWIIIFGTAYTNSKCGDSEYSQCCSANSASLQLETDISSCAYTSHYCPLLPDTSHKKDSCCEKKECTSDRVPFLNTQGHNFQTNPIYFTYTSPRHPLNRTLSTVFDQHKARQSISIYTLIQSLLC